MSKKLSEKAGRLQELTQTEKILSLTLAGYQPGQIATELGIQPTYVHEAINNALADVSQSLVEHADRLAVMNIMRIEEIITYLREPALGIPPAWADKEVLKEHPGLAEPDHRLLKIYLDSIKLEVEISKFVTGVDRENTSKNINIEHIEVTFTGNNPLYQTAKEDLQADWMRYADTDLIDLIAPGEEHLVEENKVRMALPDQDVRLREIERRIKPEPKDEDEEGQED